MLEILTELRPCPICGAKAFVRYVVYDADHLGLGWSVGCPRAYIDDPVHKLNEEEFEKAKLIMRGFLSKAQAIEAWNRRAGE